MQKEGKWEKKEELHNWSRQIRRKFRERWKWKWSTRDKAEEMKTKKKNDDDTGCKGTNYLSIMNWGKGSGNYICFLLRLLRMEMLRLTSCFVETNVICLNEHTASSLMCLETVRACQAQMQRPLFCLTTSCLRKFKLSPRTSLILFMITMLFFLFLTISLDLQLHCLQSIMFIIDIKICDLRCR